MAPKPHTRPSNFEKTGIGFDRKLGKLVTPMSPEVVTKRETRLVRSKAEAAAHRTWGDQARRLYAVERDGRAAALKDLEATRAELDATRAKSAQQVATYEDHLNRANEGVAQLVREKQVLSEERKRVGDSLNWTANRLHENQAELSKLQDSGRPEDQASISALNAQRTQLERDLGVERTRAADLDNRIRAAEDARTRLGQEKARLNDELRDAQSRALLQENELRGSLRESQDKLQQAQARLDNAEREGNATREQLARLTRERDEALTTRDQALENAERARAEHSSALRREEGLHQRVRDLESQLAAASRNPSSDPQEIAALRRELAEVRGMVAAGRGSGASSSSSSAVGGGREGGAAGGKGTLNIDVLRNAGYSESEIKAEVARALADGKEIVGGPAPKPKEPTPTSTPAAAATAAKEKEPWDERFAKVGANLNRGVGLFANPGAFVNILMAVVLVLFIWIVLKVFFPMV